MPEIKEVEEQQLFRIDPYTMYTRDYLITILGIKFVDALKNSGIKLYNRKWYYGSHINRFFEILEAPTTSEENNNEKTDNNGLQASAGPSKVAGNVIAISAHQKQKSLESQLEKAAGRKIIS